MRATIAEPAIGRHHFSTKSLNRASASSHWLEITSRQRWASASPAPSNTQSRSRPRHSSRTSPAPASTSRCLVTACRVTLAPWVRRVMESGPLVPSRLTSASRVASPSAAKMGAACSTRSAAALRRDIALDVLHLLGPAAIVHAKRFRAARERNVLEAGLAQQQPRAARRLLQAELHQGGRLFGVVHLRIDRVGVPAIREIALGFHLLNL